jgi:hypothetical protein
MSLEPDTITIPGQNYALISVVSPSSNQKTDVCGLKIKGVFATIDEAKSWAAKLQKSDATFDIYVVELYRWLPIPPEVDKIDDQVYQDGLLKDIVDGKKVEDLKAKQFFDQRMQEDLSKNVSRESQ